MHQVPLPILIVLDETWDTKCIHVPVCFSQPGAGSEISFSSIKLCFYQSGIKPNIVKRFSAIGSERQC